MFDMSDELGVFDKIKINSGILKRLTATMNKGNKMNYWLMKSEPDEFSIDDLKVCLNQTEAWHGIRNYQARNFMRDEMQIGDQVFLPFKLQSTRYCRYR